MEKLWRFKAKEPPPDIERLIATTSNRKIITLASGTGSGRRSTITSRPPPARPTEAESHNKGYWPPPPLPVTNTPEAVKKAVHLLGPAVLDSYRRTHLAESQSKDYFKDLLNTW